MYSYYRKPAQLPVNVLGSMLSGLTFHIREPIVVLFGIFLCHNLYHLAPDNEGSMFSLNKSSLRG